MHPIKCSWDPWTFLDLYTTCWPHPHILTLVWRYAQFITCVHRVDGGDIIEGCAEELFLVAPMHPIKCSWDPWTFWISSQLVGLTPTFWLLDGILHDLLHVCTEYLGERSTNGCTKELFLLGPMHHIKCSWDPWTFWSFTTCWPHPHVSTLVWHSAWLITCVHRVVGGEIIEWMCRRIVLLAPMHHTKTSMDVWECCTWQSAT